ncbi:MAG: hypothetical protein M0038_05140 [Pseudomonadota bacterium]|nr:hypothetical protein [Pseudomonadota bacterium]
MSARDLVKIKSVAPRSGVLAMMVVTAWRFVGPTAAAAPRSSLPALKAQLAQTARHMPRAELESDYVFQHLIDHLIAPIHSRAQLSAYLKRTAHTNSPLDALPPGARQRFLASLNFRNGGLEFLPFSDLLRLNAVEIYRILALFGAQADTRTIAGSDLRRLDASSADAARSAHSVCTSKWRPALKRALQVDGDWSRGPLRRRELLVATYESLLAPAQKPSDLERLPGSDLADLFEVTWEASNAANALRANQDFTGDLTLDVRALESRHLASNAEYRAYYDTLVASRHFGAAHQFYTEHPDLGLPRIPALSPRKATATYRPGNPIVLSPHSGGRFVSAHQINLRRASQVIILVSPACHFSNRFLWSAERHPRLLAALRKYSVWVTPPDGILDARTLSSWNRTHPLEPINIIDKLREWPMITIAAVPTFYFLRHGTLVATLYGWPETGRFRQLRTDLDKIGLWPPARR